MGEYGIDMIEKLKSEWRYWIAASHLSAVSVQKLQAWLKSHGDLASLFKASASELSVAGFTENEINKISGIDWDRMAAEEEWHQRHSTLITFNDPLYPPLLREIADPPLLLYLRGDPALLSAPQIAMVGSRNPSPSGLETARQFAAVLAESGFVVTSGLAAGIDRASHEGALSKGKTLAVIGTGINRCYPYMHRELAKRVSEQGALVSEFPLNLPPSKFTFPQRNRLISGLSAGVLVVEAALRSGSLITARCALEQNREVFAIPGSIHQPLARGCHHLIRQGAKLVETAQDIIEELGHLLSFSLKRDQAPKLAPQPENLDNRHRKLLEQLDYAPTPFDLIVGRSGLTATEVSSMLLTLELKEYLTLVAGGYIRK